jgi:hypothetical protein
MLAPKHMAVCVFYGAENYSFVKSVPNSAFPLFFNHIGIKDYFSAFIRTGSTNILIAIPKKALVFIFHMKCFDKVRW